MNDKVEKTAEEVKAETKAAEIKGERDRVRMTTPAKTEEKKEEVEAKTEETEETEEVETVVTENKEEIETIEKTEEELEAAKVEAKTAAEKARIQKRIDKEVAKRKVLEDEIADLKKQVAAKKAEEGEVLTKEDVEKEADKRAAQKFAQKEFDDACIRLTKAAEKLDKDFVKKINDIAKEVAPIPGHMIGILDDLDNGGQVLQHFTKDDETLEEYERIITLSPAKAAVELTKLSVKLGKPEPKKISKVPDPPTPINGNSRIPTEVVLTDKDTKDMKTFVQKRNAMIKKRNEERMAGMRR